MQAALDRLRERRVHDRLRAMLGDRTTVRVQRCFALAFRHSVTGLGLAYWSEKAGRHRYSSSTSNGLDRGHVAERGSPVERANPATSLTLIKDLVDVVNLDPARVSALHLYPHIAFIEKGSLA